MAYFYFDFRDTTSRTSAACSLLSLYQVGHEMPRHLENIPEGGEARTFVTGPPNKSRSHPSTKELFRKNCALDELRTKRRSRKHHQNHLAHENLTNILSALLGRSTTKRRRTFELLIRFFSAQVVSPDLYGCVMNSKATNHATIAIAAKGSWDRRSIQ
ncbi:hypothetical protein BC826DRAFT_392201 [Russula brevipes]|nr:hypothetical protein BC826DRAFT_392201 [Russula brevipes]